MIIDEAKTSVRTDLVVSCAGLVTNLVHIRPVGFLWQNDDEPLHLGVKHGKTVGILFGDISIWMGKAWKTYDLTNSSGFTRKMAEFQFTSGNQDILPRLIECKCKLFFICRSHFIGVLFSLIEEKRSAHLLFQSQYVNRYKWNTEWNTEWMPLFVPKGCIERWTVTPHRPERFFFFYWIYGADVATNSTCSHIAGLCHPHKPSCWGRGVHLIWS